MSRALNESDGYAGCLAYGADVFFLFASPDREVYELTLQLVNTPPRPRDAAVNFAGRW